MTIRATVGLAAALGSNVFGIVPADSQMERHLKGYDNSKLVKAMATSVAPVPSFVFAVNRVDRTAEKRELAKLIYAGMNPVRVCYEAGESDAKADPCLRGAARAAKHAADVLVEVLDEGGR